MKKLISNNNPKALKRIWYVLLIALSIGTTLVFMQRQNKGKKTSLKIDTLRDSLWAREFSSEKSFTISNLIELYEQKQLLKSFRQKDSLNQKDLESLKKIDRKLNHLIDEEN